MNKLMLFFSISLLALFISCSQQSFVKDVDINSDDMVKWTDTTKLIWDNFQGKPPKDAKTDCEIAIQLPAEFHEAQVFIPASGIVECYVDKKASWFKKGQAKSQMLTYYQVLFNLHELYARKMRKSFAEADFSVENPKAVFDSIYQLRNEELSKVAARYKRESGLGTKSKKVKEWSDKIAVELKELEEYKSQ